MDIAIIIVAKETEDLLNEHIQLKYNEYKTSFDYDIGSCEDGFTAYLLKDEEFRGKTLYKGELKIEIDSDTYNIHNKPYQMIHLHSSKDFKCTIQPGDSGAMIFNRKSPREVELYGMIIGYMEVGISTTVEDDIETNSSTERIDIETIGIAIPLSVVVEFVPKIYKLRWNSCYVAKCNIL